MRLKSTKKNEKAQSKVIFVSSPFAPCGLWTREENVELAKKLCRVVVVAGHTPIAPHLLYPQFLDDENPVERDVGMMASLSLIPLCDELWYFPDRGISQGMKNEINKAEEELIPCIKWKSEFYPHSIQSGTV